MVRVPVLSVPRIERNVNGPVITILQLTLQCLSALPGDYFRPLVSSSYKVIRINMLFDLLVPINSLIKLSTAIQDLLNASDYRDTSTLNKSRPIEFWVYFIFSNAGCAREVPLSFHS